MTTYILPPQQLITTAVLATLEAAIGAPFKIGDCETPKNPSYPFGILYPLPGGRDWSAPFGQEGLSIDIPYQLSIVGSRRDMVQLWTDKAKDVLFGRSASGALLVACPLPSGWVNCGRIADDAASGVQVEGKAPNKIYTAPLRFTMQVTPA